MLLKKYKQEINCPVCHNLNSKLFLTSLDTENISLQKYNYYRCSHCGLVFLFPFADQKTLQAYYEKKYYGGSKLLEFLQIERRNKILRLKKKGKLLDYGCGEGVFLNLMKKNFKEIYGFDISSEAARLAKKKYNLEVLTPSESLNLLSLKNFDVITLWHTLEHLTDPVALLFSFKKLLAPDGFLIIGVPNIDSWEAGIGRENWFHLDPPRHSFHYNLKSLRFLLNKVGYQIKKIDYFSLEYNFPSLWQTVINCCGSYPNFFYHYVKRQSVKNLPKKRIFLSWLVTILLGPLFFLPALLLSYYFSFSGRSGSLIIYAQKDKN